MKIKDEDLKELDEQIRLGRVQHVIQRLKKLTPSSVPRRFVQKVASLCRRAREWERGIQFLRPFVLVDYEISSEASSPELIEYAFCLAGIGAKAEAFEVLSRVDESQYPRALMVKHAILVSRWKYDASISLLEKYLSSQLPTDYEKLIAKVNLIAAFVATHQNDEARREINRFLSEKNTTKYKRLYANVLGLAAQSAISVENWEEANNYFDKSKHAVDQGLLDALFLEKWQAIATIHASPSKGLKKLREVRDKAQARGHWETVRSCDIHDALATQNKNLFCKVYFGTPFNELRHRFLERSQDWFPSIPSTYLWTPADRPARTIDVSDRLESAFPNLSPKLGGLFLYLTTDFYRPFRYGSLHEAIYSGEKFNPGSTPLKIRKAVQRLRAVLKEKGIQIEEQKGAYRLTFIENSGILVNYQRNKALSLPLEDKILNFFSSKEFTAKEASTSLKVPLRTCQHALKNAVKKGKVKIIKKTRLNFYKAA